MGSGMRGGIRGETHMRDDGDAVGREVHVRLDGVGADARGGTEGGHRVLRVGGLVAAVGDGLGDAPRGGAR